MMIALWMRLVNSIPEQLCNILFIELGPKMAIATRVHHTMMKKESSFLSGYSYVLAKMCLESEGPRPLS